MTNSCTGLSMIYPILGAMFLWGVSSTAVVANNTCSILPAEASALSEPRLCRTDHPNDQGLAVCRDYSDDQRIYQLVYQGGTTPVAIYESAGVKLPIQKLVMSDRPNEDRKHCELARPEAIPVAAAYRGTGVCMDEQRLPLPCSLFEHVGAREPEAKRYFVYYEPDGSGVRSIDALSTGLNKHALEAEFAFQLGLAFMNANCCREQAQAYLEHAAVLYPDDNIYRVTLTAHLNGGDREASSPLASFNRMLDRSP